MLLNFLVIGCSGPYSCSASPLIRQISERSLPISFVTYLRFCSVMSLAAPAGPSMLSPKIVLHFYLFRSGYNILTIIIVSINIKSCQSPQGTGQSPLYADPIDIGRDVQAHLFGDLLQRFGIIFAIRKYCQNWPPGSQRPP